jgi:alkylhydroperoxidase domain protein
MEQGRHCYPGAAYCVCELPEPTHHRAAAAERQARRQKRCAGGGRHLAHDRNNGHRKGGPRRVHPAGAGWEPWIAAKPLADFRDDEVAILAKFGHTDSDYFRLLARNLPVLEQRTLTDKGIFYTSGLPRAERELAATVASKINGCIYCASVHARKASQLSKDDAAVEALLAVRPGRSLARGNPHAGRRKSILRRRCRSRRLPPRRCTLPRWKKRAGYLAQLDLVQSAAFFAWANRLMLTLGEPWLAEACQASARALA